jgi:hypothetical protein
MHRFFGHGESDCACIELPLLLFQYLLLVVLGLAELFSLPAWSAICGEIE